MKFTIHHLPNFQLFFRCHLSFMVKQKLANNLVNGNCTNGKLIDGVY